MAVVDSRITTAGLPRVVAVVFAVLLLVICAGPAVAQDEPRDPPPARRGFWGRTQAPSDSLGAFAGSLWGPVSARHDSVSVRLVNHSRPGWETAVLVPYWIVGIPFRIVYFGLDQAVIGMDKLGLFGEAGEYPGLKIPGDAYLMPIISIGDLEGWTFGLEVTRPHFLGPNNMLFIQGSRSTRKADALSGGTLFQLGQGWTVQVGGGTEEKNLTRYYGVGPDSYYGDLSYYHRITSWGGFELEKDVGKKTALELRTYFSKVQALEPVYEVDQSVGQCAQPATVGQQVLDRQVGFVSGAHLYPPRRYRARNRFSGIVWIRRPTLTECARMRGWESVRRTSPKR